MKCSYYERKLCHSCSLMNSSREEEQTLKTSSFDFPVEYLESPRPFHFRNKAKMVVSGTYENPILGLMGGIDLCDCPLYPEEMQKAFPLIKEFIKKAQLVPYDIKKKKGELKYVILFYAASTKEFMLRFVLASKKSLKKLEAQELLPFKVISLNIQPVHQAILEGEEEILLTPGKDHVIEKLAGIPLAVYPKSFFQTNSLVAEELYLCAAEWLSKLPLKSFWDLFCGVGGFALFVASKHPNKPQGLGIELQEAAIKGALQSSKDLNLDSHLSFMAQDVASFQGGLPPDLIILNPPRRGLGEELCKLISAQNPSYILYSSCNAQSLKQDCEILREEGAYEIEKIKVFNMFPHSPHSEILMLLVKKA